MYPVLSVMHRVTLKFKSEHAMRAFYESCKVHEAEMNIRTLTILCNCEEKDIELAVNKFDAIVIRREMIK